MLRAVLFDAVGTLLRPAEPVGETYAREARARGADIPAWRLEDAQRRVLRSAPPLGFPGAEPRRIPELEREWWRARVRETLRAADQAAPVADFEGCFSALWTHFARPDAWLPLPGAAQVLEALRASGLATAVISNFDHRLEAILAGLGLLDLLDIVVLPSHAGAGKPDRRIFAFALQRLDVAAADAVYVGDDPEQDVAGARAAGLEAIDVTGLATLAELPRRLGLVQPEPRP